MNIQSTPRNYQHNCI